MSFRDWSLDQILLLPLVHDVVPAGIFRARTIGALMRPARTWSKKWGARHAKAVELLLSTTTDPSFMRAWGLAKLPKLGTI